MALTRPWASWAALIACLVSFSANSGFWAMRSAMARPNASSSARGTTWFTMPSRCASSAPIQSAVNRNSLALRTPSSQGWAKNSAPPTPIATVWSRNSASSTATIRSHGQISIRPPAITLPCTSAMVGLGMLRQRSQKPT